MFIEKLTSDDIKELCGRLKLKYENQHIHTSKKELMFGENFEDFVWSPMIFYGQREWHLNTLYVCHYFEYDEGSYSENSKFTDYACVYSHAQDGNLTLDMINSVYRDFMAKKFRNYEAEFAKQKAKKTSEFKNQLKEILSLAYKKESGKIVRRQIFTQKMINEAASNLVALLCEGADPNGKLNDKHTFIEIAKELRYNPLIKALEQFKAANAEKQL